MNVRIEELKQKAKQALGAKFDDKMARIEADALEWGNPKSKRYQSIVIGGLEGAIENAKYETVFIPPSQETLDCGGFLGGEWVRVKKI